MLRQIGQQLLESLSQTDKPEVRKWNFVLYPNPVSRVLHIDLEDQEESPFGGVFMIYDSEDNMKYEQMMSEGKHDIDISWLKPGIYIAKLVMHEGDEQVSRFIKH